MRSPLLIILAPFVFLAIFMNSPWRDSLRPSVPSTRVSDEEWAAGAEQRRRDAEREVAAIQQAQRERVQRGDLPAPERTGQSTARTVAASVSGGLDSPMDSILPQIPYSPDLSRSGRYREFTYRFEDGSRLVLTAVPTGGQTGLVLYSVDIQE